MAGTSVTFNATLNLSHVSRACQSDFAVQKRGLLEPHLQFEVCAVEPRMAHLVPLGRGYTMMWGYVASTATQNLVKVEGHTVSIRYQEIH